MEASTRAALAEVRERLSAATRGAAGPALVALADELFAVAHLLQEQPSLRRALSDPAGTPDERAALTQRLFGPRLTPTALGVVELVARQRWSRPVDLIDATTALATDVSLDAAEARGELESVEDELFRFGRIVAADRDLGRILSDRSAPAAGKTELLVRLLSGRVSPVTEQLLHNVLTGRMEGSAAVAIERLSEVASHRRGQSVARVTTAVPLTDAQERRLSDVLGRIYGRTVGLQVTVDPAVLGGLVVHLGDEVIDGSVLQRLEAARRQLAG